MKKLLLLLIWMSFSMTQAQDKDHSAVYWAANIGYMNLNGNYLKLGPEIYWVQKNSNIIDLGANANLAYFKKHFVVVPELSIGYLFNFSNKRMDPYSTYMNAPFYLLRVNSSPWHIQPEAGITLLGMLEATVGYSFEFSEHDYTGFDGLKFGLQFHIPLDLFAK